MDGGPFTAVSGSGRYFVVQLLIQRGLAFAYLVGFVVALRQYVPLYGSDGILPLRDRIENRDLDDGLTIFRVAASDCALRTAAWAGITLSVLALTGISERFGPLFSIAVWLSLWVLFLSFYNAGEVFYEDTFDNLLLIELGFLAVFLGCFSTPPPEIVIWLMRWTLFRVMFGAGLAKLESDGCWTDLSCLPHHFETMSFPNPLSWYLYRFPRPFHTVAMVLTLLVQITVPFLYFAPQPMAAAAGVVTILFQLGIFVSGNYAKINVLTIVLSVSTFDDSLLGRLIDLGVQPGPVPRIQVFGAWIALGIVLALSYRPVSDMLSGGSGYERYPNLPIVNNYTLFTNPPRRRLELVLEGTDGIPGENPTWKEYRFFGKPEDVSSRPRQFAPYNYKLEFRLTSEPRRDEPSDWFLRFLERILDGSDSVRQLVRHDPFPESPPTYVRARTFRYRYTTPEERTETGDWWKREPVGVFQDPLHLSDFAGE